MVRRFELDEDSKLSKEQVKELEEGEKASIVHDEDSPGLSEEMVKEFRKVAERRKEDNRKQNLTLRVSRKTLDKARKLGKGYTRVISRIIDDAFDDPDFLRKYL